MMAQHLIQTDFKGGIVSTLRKNIPILQLYLHKYMFEIIE